VTDRVAAPVLILTNQRDFAADRVIRCLQDVDVPVERWNAEDQRVVAWRPEQAQFDRPPRAVWLRQFLPEPTVMGDVHEVDDFLVAREQWRTWLSDLAEDPGPRWMNPLWASRRAENKLVQLRVARECGLEAPATLMTNNRAVALRHQVAVGPCVVKSVASAYFPFSDSSFMFTVDLDEAAHLPEDEWAAQPLLVQKAVAKGADVRVFMVGDFVAAVSTYVDVTDWRTASSDAKWEHQDIPPHIVASCLDYLKCLGLAYGAFDFVVDQTSQWWFLECNQAGEFSFADRPLNLGVSDAIAQWLAAEQR
jgi:glutathione synthase/RimK-type ligase-like ATP-grasp enzyme